MWWWTWLACGGGAVGELWLTVEETSPGGDHVTLTFPATSLRDDGEPVVLDTTSGGVDLRQAASRLRPGSTQRWTGDDGETITLAHQLDDAAVATSVVVGVTGKLGNGLELSFPLEPEQVRAAVGKAELAPNGLPGLFDEAGCAQLRRSPPTLLVEVAGPKGNGLRVRSR
jgi:hypothetical protein